MKEPVFKVNEWGQESLSSGGLELVVSFVLNTGRPRTGAVRSNGFWMDSEVIPSECSRQRFFSKEC